MHELPRFLRKQTPVEPGSIGDIAEPYRPLIAAWLIEMALCLGWYRKSNPKRLPEIFANHYFVRCTGIEVPRGRPTDDDDDECFPAAWPVIGRISDGAFARRLKKALTTVRNQQLDPDLPLFRNIELLAGLLGLGDAEKQVLTFFVALHAFPQFKEFISERNTAFTKVTLIKLLAALFGPPEAEIQSALNEEGTLVASGILSFDSSNWNLECAVTLMSGLNAALLMPHTSDIELADRFLKRAAPAGNSCEAFPHLEKDIRLITSYLRAVLQAGTAGSNLLFYGLPGTGKTELAKAIAAALGTHLYEIGFADAGGGPIKGTQRLHAFNLCQRILAQQRNAILMFDEIEDVLESRNNFWFLFGGDGPSAGGSGKAWINRTLEGNPIPAIWITNDPDIDPAYLRRFDYSVRFPIPPQPVRLTIAKKYLEDFDPPPEWLARIATNEQTSPAQLEAAAKVARLVADTGDHAHAQALVEQTLDRSATLLDQKRTPARVVLHTRYDLAFVNADIDVAKIVARLKVRPHGTFCFFGPAGTGKSEFARHIADEIGKPILVRRASDLLSTWLGQSEKNIARMFAEARQQDALLVLDEADSFLADRRGAQRSWEVTQVNELLTQMEAFDGMFVCTTNLMDSLDPASLRRFAFKVKFDYLTADQRWTMFRRELARLSGDEQQALSWEPLVRGLNRLTPGDFAVAARQAELWGATPTVPELYEQLRKECEAKEEGVKSIGFTA